MRTTLHCIHGFLGSPADWEPLFPLQSGMPSVKYDLFHPSTPTVVTTGLGEVGSWVNRQAKVQSGSRILIGYSLGGRIALHSLLQAPEIWSAAVIVSAHLGLRKDQVAERRGRIKADEEWAQKFETGNWDDVVSEWDAQGVLQGGLDGGLKTSETVRPRLEEDFSRFKLASSLRHCSLGWQMDLRPALRRLQVPILWISGEQDVKYRTIAQEAAELNPRFESKVISGGGHRILWERPQEFAQLVLSYLGRLSIKARSLEKV